MEEVSRRPALLSEVCQKCHNARGYFYSVEDEGKQIEVCRQCARLLFKSQVTRPTKPQLLAMEIEKSEDAPNQVEERIEEVLRLARLELGQAIYGRRPNDEKRGAKELAQASCFAYALQYLRVSDSERIRAAFKQSLTILELAYRTMRPDCKFEDGVLRPLNRRERTQLNFAIEIGFHVFQRLKQVAYSGTPEPR